MIRRSKLACTVIGCLAGATSSVAYATTYAGQVTGVQGQPSPTTPGNIRVSIHVTLTKIGRAHV